MKGLFVSVLLICIAPGAAPAALDAAGRPWIRTIGSSSQYPDEELLCVAQTPDHDFLLAGLTSHGEDFYNSDGLITKFDGTGNLLWQKRYPSRGSGDDVLGWVEPLEANGYMAAGSIASERYCDLWCLRIDGDGDILWQKRYIEEAETSLANCIHPLSDGGFVVVGGVGYYPYHGLILRIDADGTTRWQRILVGPRNSTLYKVFELSDGGFVAAGAIESTHRGSDGWLVRLDADGNVLWEYAYGRSDLKDHYDVFNDFELAPDGSYVVAGVTAPHKHGEYGTDAWFLRISSDGSKIRWQRRIRVRGNIGFMGVAGDGTSGYLLGGALYEDDGQWGICTRIGSGGKVQWQRKYGPSQLEILAPMRLDDGSIAIGGLSREYKFRIAQLGQAGDACEDWSQLAPPGVFDTHIVPRQIHSTITDMAIKVQDTDVVPVSSNYPLEKDCN